MISLTLLTSPLRPLPTPAIITLHLRFTAAIHRILRLLLYRTKRSCCAPSPAVWFALSPVLVIAALTSACGGDGGGAIQDPEPVTSITVAAPATTIPVAQTVQLTATAKDRAGAVVEGTTFAWTTSDASVASVSQSGLVTGTAEGQVEIRATNEAVTGTIAITVAAATPPPPPPPPGTVTPALHRWPRDSGSPLT